MIITYTQLSQKFVKSLTYHKADNGWNSSYPGADEASISVPIPGFYSVLDEELGGFQTLRLDTTLSSYVELVCN